MIRSFGEAKAQLVCPIEQQTEVVFYQDLREILANHVLSATQQYNETVALLDSRIREGSRRAKRVA